MRSLLPALCGAACFGVVSLGMTPFACADTTASYFLGGGLLTQNQANAIGWEFTVTDYVAVSSLGIWDAAGDGLSKVHQVGIFRADGGALVVGASIIDGTQATLIDGSRFVNVAPTTLSPGVTYYILGDDFTADPYVSGAGSMGFAPEVSWIALADGTSNSIFTTPTFTPGSLGNLGPNFRYTVPGPGGVAMLGVGALLIGARRRRN
jgi:hypothetical protein